MFKLVALTALLCAASLVAASHTFNFYNECEYTVHPKIVNVNCGYSPRCNTPGSGGVPGLPTNPAISYTGPQPSPLGPNQSSTLPINGQWNGRIFHQNNRCGAFGESCTLGEFNLDTGNQFTAQAFDISNIQGFTIGMKIAIAGGDSVTCSNINCGCKNAYSPGDTTGCGKDSPVRAGSTGDKTWKVTFCPWPKRTLIVDDWKLIKNGLLLRIERL